jgi:hypothetical protein
MSAIRSQITDTEIAGGGVGLVKIRYHPRDRKYAEASTIFFFFFFVPCCWFYNVLHQFVYHMPCKYNARPTLAT